MKEAPKQLGAQVQAGLSVRRNLAIIAVIQMIATRLLQHCLHVSFYLLIVAVVDLNCTCCSRMTTKTWYINIEAVNTLGEGGNTLR